MTADIDAVLALLHARTRWDNLPKCTDCWRRDDGRSPSRMVEADEERCRWCGATTTAGIYVRAQDPAIVAAVEVIERLTAERDRLREAALTVHRLVDHWAECPAPPDASCDECHAYYAAKADLSRALGEPPVPDEPTATRLEHVGHGEGVSMFIGHVSGCPACEAVGVPDEPTKRWIPSQEALAAATTTMTVYGSDGPTEMLILRRPLLQSHSTGEERTDGN